MSLSDRLLRWVGLARRSDLLHAQALAHSTASNLQSIISRLREQIAAEQTATRHLFELREQRLPVVHSASYPTHDDMTAHRVRISLDEMVFLHTEFSMLTESEKALLRQRALLAIMGQISNKIVRLCSGLFTGAHNHLDKPDNTGTIADAALSRTDQPPVAGDHSDGAAEVVARGDAVDAVSSGPKPPVIRDRKTARSKSVSRPRAKSGPRSDKSRKSSPRR